ncbi:hypothetical protein [Rhizobium sp.]|uniref:hypothetical protein n=1 Tax=Rhizobium sp. TaxID=391 RepID=UPI0034C5DE77
MAFDIFEWLKKQADNGSDPSVWLSTQLPDTGPIPQQRPALLDTSAVTGSIQQAPAAQTPAADAPSASGGGLLSLFGLSNPLIDRLQKDPEKQAALRDGMLQGFGSMMIANGPSVDPSHSSLLSGLGYAVANGNKGYSDSLKNNSEIGVGKAKVASGKLAQQQAAGAAALASALGGPGNGQGGFTIDQLMEIMQAQLANGQWSEAARTQEQIQQLQQTAAKNGQVIDGGKLVNAPGAVQSATELETGKGFGQQIGKNEADLTNPATSNVQDYTFYANQERSAGRSPKSYEDWNTTQKNAGSTKINNSMGGTSNTEIFKVMQDKADVANQAVKGNDSIQTARDAINSGAILGYGADTRLGLKKIASFLGADPTSVENTETFRAAIAPQVSAMIKSTVGSANISDSDRKFAEQAAGGSITLDAGSISRLLDIMQRANNATIADYNQRLDKVYPQSEDGKYDREREILRLQAPSYQPQQKPSQLLGGRVAPSVGDNPDNLPVVNSAADRAKLKPGQKFIGPDGNTYTN